ncbi:uncharacterized protein [Neodiprion pinetum]|uniref:uncharacterized protein n=1 Tax=Neodiprion pinetum TaxID=441929 RepID=UPI001EE0FF6E|nr:uncharacterized protein LOC124210987 [Neodiprion pinetum]
MFTILISTYWYLWAAVLAGLAITAVCACWFWKHYATGSIEDGSPSDRTSAASCYLPPHYSRCSSFFQALPPPYNEVTSKPDLYPLVIGYDEGIGKSTSGLVMRYFRSLSHASTLDSLSSSFMCNVVNEANTIIPPPYSCNNSIDELSTVECSRGPNLNGGSIISLANHRTTSDISSLAAQSPCSPPRATTPTIEVRELLDKIHQLPAQFPHEPNVNVLTTQNRPQMLDTLSSFGALTRPLSPGELVAFRPRRARGKMYMPLGLPSSRSKSKRWLSRSAPTTPCGTAPPPLLPGQNRRPSQVENKSIDYQGVPLLSEQDEEPQQV